MDVACSNVPTNVCTNPGQSISSVRAHGWHLLVYVSLNGIPGTGECIESGLCQPEVCDGVRLVERLGAVEHASRIDEVQHAPRH